MNIIKKQFDENYFENIGYREVPNSRRNRNRLYEILNHKNEGKLLEVGCGNGGFLELAAKHFDVEGMDISKYAIDSIKQTFGDKVRIADIENTKLPPDHYDVIVILNVLEHLKKPGKVIDKIFYSLKKTGIVVGSVPHNYGFVGRLHTSFTNFIDKTHVSTYPPDHWQALFKQAGFKNLSFFGEIMLGRNLNKYIQNRYWRHISFNLIFLCEK